MRAPRGFAAISPERRKKIAAMGGRAVQAHQRSFSKNRTLASQAGKKGGKGTPAHLRMFAQDPVLAARAGRKGGAAEREGRGFSTDRKLARQAGRVGGKKKRVPKA